MRFGRDVWRDPDTADPIFDNFRLPINQWVDHRNAIKQRFQAGKAEGLSDWSTKVNMDTIKKIAQVIAKSKEVYISRNPQLLCKLDKLMFIRPFACNI